MVDLNCTEDIFKTESCRVSEPNINAMTIVKKKNLIQILITPVSLPELNENYQDDIGALTEEAP